MNFGLMTIFRVSKTYRNITTGNLSTPHTPHTHSL